MQMLAIYLENILDNAKLLRGAVLNSTAAKALSLVCAFRFRNILIFFLPSHFSY